MGPGHSFKPKCLFMLKISLTLANSDRTICTNMFSSNSDGWHLAIQACFSLKIQHIPQVSVKARHGQDANSDTNSDTDLNISFLSR